MVVHYELHDLDILLSVRPARGSSVLRMRILRRGENPPLLAGPEPPTTETLSVLQQEVLALDQPGGERATRLQPAGQPPWDVPSLSVKELRFRRTRVRRSTDDGDTVPQFHLSENGWDVDAWIIDGEARCICLTAVR